MSHTLLFLLFLISNTGSFVSAMNKEITLAQDMSTTMVITGFKSLPNDIKKHIISLLLQNTIGYRMILFKQFDIGKSMTNAVAFSPEGETCLTGSNESTTFLWNSKTGELLKAFKENQLLLKTTPSAPASKWVTSVAYNKTGVMIALGGHDAFIYLWNLKTGELVRTIPAQNAISSLAFSPDENTILIGQETTTPVLVSLHTGEIVTTFTGHTRPITSVAFSHDGEKCLTGSKDTTACLWNSKTGTMITVFKRHTGSITSVALSPDGEKCLTGSKDTTVCMWNSKTGQLLFFKNLGFIDTCTTLSFSPNGRSFLTGTESFEVCLWSSTTGERLAYFRGEYPITSAAFSPDGSTILVGQHDSSLCSCTSERKAFCSCIENTAYLLRVLVGFESLTKEQKEDSFKQFMTYYPLLSATEAV